MRTMKTKFALELKNIVTEIFHNLYCGSFETLVFCET